MNERNPLNDVYKETILQVIYIGNQNLKPELPSTKCLINYFNRGKIPAPKYNPHFAHL